jgi:hypothetical protein
MFGSRGRYWRRGAAFGSGARIVDTQWSNAGNGAALAYDSKALLLIKIALYLIPGIIRKYHTVIISNIFKKINVKSRIEAINIECITCGNCGHVFHSDAFGTKQRNHCPRCLKRA